MGLAGPGSDWVGDRRASESSPCGEGGAVTGTAATACWHTSAGPRKWPPLVSQEAQMGPGECCDTHSSSCMASVGESRHAEGRGDDGEEPKDGATDGEDV
jgi:hypothetical protein